jgi:hypothetical protein
MLSEYLLLHAIRLRERNTGLMPGGQWVQVLQLLYCIRFFSRLHMHCCLPAATAFPASAGMNKMVINHLEKLFVTSDASTIVTEMDVYHPAAKLLVMAAKAQAGEVGDATNLVNRVQGRTFICNAQQWSDFAAAFA